MLDKLKFKRVKEMAPLEREIVQMLFAFLDKKRFTDQWWHYAGEFKYEGTEYTLEVDARMDNQMLTYKNLHIEHKQIVIDIEEMAKNGLLQ